MRNDSQLIAHLFDRIEERLAAIASRANLQALLSRANPGLLVPSPAVGVMETKCTCSIDLDQDAYFLPRDVGDTGRGLMLTLAVEHGMVHPWQVRSAEWLPPSTSSTAAAQSRAGISVELCRSEESTANTGWLNLLCFGGVSLAPALKKLRAELDGQSVEVRRCRPVLASDGMHWSGAQAFVHHLQAVCDHIIQICVPTTLMNKLNLTLKLYFAYDLSGNASEEFPEVITNAMPVWNSLNWEYPDFAEIEQTVSETQHQLIHPLRCTGAFEHWRPWMVSRVHATGITAERGPERPAGDFRHHRSDSCLDYGFALLPAGLTTQTAHSGNTDGIAPMHLSVLLTEDSREYLDVRDAQLRVDFRATTGALANSMGQNSRFTVDFRKPRLAAHQISGQLRGRMWGGSDGFASVLGVDNTGACDWLFLTGRLTTVGEILAAFKQYYAGYLEIVDTYDFVRCGDNVMAAPLVVRVRCMRQFEHEDEKRMVFAACESFLNHYLAPLLTGSIVLMEESDA